jgi:two-component system cell cycle sensor histidine kinase/response regulator CckA
VLSQFPESSLRVALEHLLEGIQFIGYDWKYQYVNAAAARHGQREASDLIGRTVMEAYPGIENTDVFTALQRVMRTRRPERSISEFTFSSGSTGSFELLIEPAPEGICVLSLDVGDRRVMEQQLRQAQKLETMGRLTGGVAHDFNNLLTAILGYTDLVAEEIADEQAAADLGEIRKAAERAARLTRQLLAFSRQQAIVPQVLDLNDVIRDLQPMLSRLLRDVQITMSTSDSPALAVCDPGHIEQMVLNLAVNARDAMPQGGSLSVETAHVDVELGRPPSPASSGPHVVLRVRDNGSGMPPEVLARALDPFFTTKGPETGTGLGLATVQDLVRQHSGFLTIESAPGAGTTVEIFLPSVADRRARGVREGRPMAPAGSETILIVEQDPAIRDVMSRALRSWGYRVLLGPDAQGAIDLVGDTGDRVDLLISETLMPEMHGAHLAQQLVGFNPAMRVLFITGYPDTRAIDSGSSGGRVALLPKPFTLATLAIRVRESLDRPVTIS